MSYGGFGRPEDPTETERWERLKVASAPKPPGEGHRTGTGGPDAPGASEGLDAALHAALYEAYIEITYVPDWEIYEGSCRVCDNYCADGDKADITTDASEHIAVVHVRSAKDAAPILRQAVAEESRRFWPKVEEDSRTGCWVWTGTTFDGYGIFSQVRTTTIRAHRWSYQQFVGPIPDGLTLDHLCKNRACVNPRHLEPVTIGENTLRGDGPSAINSRKDECVNGHRFTESNTYVDGRGHRNCRLCRQISSRESKRRRKARAAEIAREVGRGE